MNKWRYIHRYNDLVEGDQARPFTCPNCGQTLVYLANMADEPVAWCAFDDNTFEPGTKFWADVKAVVDEFFVE